VQTLGEVPESFAVTSEHTDRLSAQASRLNQAEILRAIDLLAAAIAAVKDGSEPRIQLEMALLKASQPSSDLSLQALMFRIEQLEARVQGKAAAPAEEAAPEQPQASAPKPKARAAASAAPAAAVAQQPVEETEVQPQLELAKLVQLWPAALEVIAERNELLGATLAETRPHALDGARLVIAFPPDQEFARKKAEAKRDVVVHALHGLTGATLQIAFEVNSDARPREAQKLSTDELIEKVKRDFGATELEEES